MATPTMKAVICPKYGPPEVLQIKEIPIPTPKANEILVQVVASPVNTADTRIRGLSVKGFMRFVMRLALGFTKPRQKVLGTIFSGIVVQTGDQVSRFQVGDKVFGSTGFKLKTNAEYVCLKGNGVISPKPANASFEEAAALPFGGQTAIYFLEKAKIKEKENPTVLIYGATGAVGCASLQIAKYYQAEVTAVCSSRGTALAKELGADHIFRYDQEDFTQTSKKFDIIFDAVGKTSKKICRPLLKPDGRFLTVEGMDVAAEKTEQLDLLRKLFETGLYQAVIDKIYPMEEVVAAHTYVDSGRKKGNVVLQISKSDQ
ncbi:MAG TPA: NAD(P)-dependent alcohol dehydrogenase [Saprospiraceae bacterium]|nr:NAD(P)-dependent alcohol dehydrogenase [Saprospiraceae bacterium]